MLRHPLEVIFIGLEVAAMSLETAFQVAQKLPGVEAISGRVLDSVFGPADEFDYVSTTTPVEPPPET